MGTPSQVIGHRYTFYPSWLAQACVNRGWIFVTPDYRLIPEVTAHASVEDAVDAYHWVLTSLSSHIGIELGPVVLAGSSAGGFLALTTSVIVTQKPAALVSIYGMLDMANERYLTKGSNIFGLPVFDTTKIKQSLIELKKPVLSAYPYPANASTDPRIGIIATLHIDALFPGYMTGVSGLTEKIISEGVEAIPASHRSLYPLTFGDLGDLPPTVVVHGRNDSAVPAALSEVAVEKLRAAGVSVHSEFPDVGEHGFDGVAGKKLEQETTGELAAPSFQSLRNTLKTLEQIVAKAAARPC
jgi:acetyl esterase/lipase